MDRWSYWMDSGGTTTDNSKNLRNLGLQNSLEEEIAE